MHETRACNCPGSRGRTRPRRPLGNVETNDYSGKPISHRLETVGKTAYNLFAVENLKTSGWSTTPALSAAGTTLAKESRSFRVYNIALAK